MSPMFRALHKHVPLIRTSLQVPTMLQLVHAQLSMAQSFRAENLVRLVSGPLLCAGNAHAAAWAREAEACGMLVRVPTLEVHLP